MKVKSKKGFTLVELLVVIAIIGILAVVAVPSLFKNINKARVAELESDYNVIKNATMSYYIDHNEIPPASMLSEENAISEYMENTIEKTPIGGQYYLLPNTETENNSGNYMDGLGYYYKLSEDGSKLVPLSKDGTNYIKDNFQVVLQVRPIWEREKEISESTPIKESPKFDMDMVNKLANDLGKENVFVSHDSTDGYGVELCIGIMRK